jgi:hypothetical protein
MAEEKAFVSWTGQKVYFFFALSTVTFGPHPVPCPKSTRYPFTGIKQKGNEIDQFVLLVPRLRMF